MKSSFLILLFCALSMGSVFSQSQPVINTEPVERLPVVGEFAIGVGASSFLSYIGNMFNGNTYNSVAFNFVKSNAIMGKYMLSNDRAIRVGARLSYKNVSKESQSIKDLVTPPTTPEYVVDKATMSGSNLYLSAGYEIRKGNKKIQAFYGGEITLAYGGGGTNKYTYGNPYTGVFTNPTTTEFSGIADLSGINRNKFSDSRVTDYTVGSTLSLGARAFVGLEYFIIPKLSLSGEFGWGLSYASTGESESNQEYWDFTNKVAKTTNTKSLGSSKMNIDTDAFSGIISLYFYF